MNKIKQIMSLVTCLMILLSVAVLRSNKMVWQLPFVHLADGIPCQWHEPMADSRSGGDDRHGVRISSFRQEEPLLRPCLSVRFAATGCRSTNPS